MKTVTITNIDNETVEITSNDYQTFVDVVTTDDNWDKCEIYFERAGWVFLRSQIEEIEQREIEYNDEDLDSYLENFFTNHMFLEEATWG